MTNNKKESFQRLSKARLEKVTSALDVLGNCSNRSAYEFTEDEVVGIFSTIEEKVRQTKSLFKFEPSVSIVGEATRKTFKQLASSLWTHGSANAAFYNTQWGQNCVKFFVRDSIFWITCYAVNYKDAEKRAYGIFISHRGYFEHSNKRSDEVIRIEKLRSLIENNRLSLLDRLPESSVAGDKDYEGLAGWQRDLSEFSSDEEAITWLEETLDSYVELFVPLIKQVG